jgi:hypothetical protein
MEQDENDKYVNQLRNYIHTFKSAALNKLESANPNNPNKTHDVNRLVNETKKIINFGTALSTYFSPNPTTPLENIKKVLYENHKCVLGIEVAMPDFDELKEKIPPDIAKHYINNDTKYNTYIIKST